MLIVLTALVLAGADSIDAATLGIFPVSSSDRRVESGLLGQVLLPQAAGAAGSLQPDGAEVRKRTTGEEVKKCNEVWSSYNNGFSHIVEDFFTLLIQYNVVAKLRVGPILVHNSNGIQNFCPRDDWSNGQTP